MKGIEYLISPGPARGSEVSVACPECGISYDHRVSAITTTDPRDIVIFDGVSQCVSCPSCKSPFLIQALPASN